VAHLGASRLWLLAVSIFFGFSVNCVAQQSYRSYQQLSGQVLRTVGQQQPNASPRHNMPLRFQGWKHPEQFGPDYMNRFSRPRESVRRATHLSAAANAASNSFLAFSSAQFAPSALPGLLLRPSLPAGYIPTAVASGDFNGDGNPDFVVANGGDNTLWLYFGKGDGTFNLPIILPITMGLTPMWIATGDLRGIGRTDLIVAEADSNSVGVFLNNGNGTFAESSIAVPNAPFALALGDFNHDGKLDIAAAGDDPNAGYISVLPGNGTGSFGKPILTPAVLGIFWLSTADLNGDGFPDLVVTNSANEYGSETKPH
jgi:VCBS repeat protein